LDMGVLLRRPRLVRRSMVLARCGPERVNVSLILSGVAW
jgi:hypothetical protein